jgi:hypothetical protein
MSEGLKSLMCFKERVMRKRWLLTICSALWAVNTGLAQQTPVAKTADNGPSLEVTMQFIQDKLKAKLFRWDDVKANPANCQITFARSGKWAENNLGKEWEDETLTFSLNDVEKIELTPGDDGSGLFLRVLTTTERSVHTRHFKNDKPRPKYDSDSGVWLLQYRLDEELANRLAKAMLHAVELCGGGSQPEPF